MLSQCRDSLFTNLNGLICIYEPYVIISTQNEECHVIVAVSHTGHTFCLVLHARTQKRVWYGVDLLSIRLDLFMKQLQSQAQAISSCKSKTWVKGFLDLRSPQERNLIYGHMLMF